MFYLKYSFRFLTRCRDYLIPLFFDYINLYHYHSDSIYAKLFLTRVIDNSLTRNSDDLSTIFETLIWLNHARTWPYIGERYVRSVDQVKILLLI